MIRKASREQGSKIVLALDLEDPDRGRLIQRSMDVLSSVAEHVCAVKLNRQLVLALGLWGGVDSIVSAIHEFSLPAIMDAKLNDVGHTNEFMARSYFDAGFDALIASPITGWEGGMDSVFKLATARGKAVIMLTYMSNPGARTFYSMRTSMDNGPTRPMFEMFIEMAREWKAYGLIVGATKPEIIRRARDVAGRELAIFSPGVGAQGGDSRAAMAAGSDYLIVGRAIYEASDPKAIARQYAELAA
jgi:orotidine-5'-phosphate decarboxylase